MVVVLEKNGGHKGGICGDGPSLRVEGNCVVRALVFMWLLSFCLSILGF